MDKVTADKMEKVVSREGNVDKIQELFSWMPLVDSLDRSTRYDVTFESGAQALGIRGKHLTDADAFNAVDSSCWDAYGTNNIVICYYE